jgi:5-hydroxyisourate hydrolase
MGISTHVLDTAAGRPAAGVRVTLRREGEAGPLAETVTNADGRTDRPLLADDAAVPGVYEITFEIGAYYAAAGVKTFLDAVPVRFRLEAGHYHVPLLVAPWSYSTYRGS